MTGRAKWDAWDAAGKKYSGGTGAESRYLEIARDLGWQPGVSSNKSKESDDESDSSSESGGGGSSGMGVVVSSMAAPETETDNSTHGLAIAGDADKLETLISLDKDIDLNALDDFASAALTKLVFFSNNFLRDIHLFILLATEVMLRSYGC